MVRLPAGERLPFSAYVARRIRGSLEELPFAGWLRGESTLVPVPRAALLQPGALWPALNIAKALVAEGLAREVRPLLTRTIPVPKSAFSQRGKRPLPRVHHDSLAAERTLHEPIDILLIDDVVTKGATVLGAAWRLREEFPGARIRALAILRTLGRVREIEAIVAPCVGRISLTGEDAVRVP